LPEFTDRAEYEKYRAEMLKKLQQSQEPRPDKQPAGSKNTADKSKTGRRTFAVVVTIVSLSFLGIGLAVLSLFMFVIHTPADKESPHRILLTREEIPLDSIQDGEPGSNRGKEGDAEATQSPPWKLGFTKGREIAGVFLTNKQVLKQKECAEAMLKIQMRSEDYLRGCLEGYNSLGRGGGRAR